MLWKQCSDFVLALGLLDVGNYEDQSCPSIKLECNRSRLYRGLKLGTTNLHCGHPSSATVHHSLGAASITRRMRRQSPPYQI